MWYFGRFSCAFDQTTMNKLCIFAALIASAFSDVGEIDRHFEGYVYPAPPQLDPPVYLPPIFSDEPPNNNYLPPSEGAFPPLDDTVIIPALPPPNSYLPPQNSYLPPTNNPVQFHIENMSCSQGLNFKAIFKMQNDLPQYPVVDEATEGCITLIGSNRFKIELENFGNMLKCGVKRCKSGENNNMCVMVRLPIVRGVRLPEDQVVTLMCIPQERVVSQTKHVKLGSNRIQQISRARSNSNFVATGGTQKDLKTNIGIFRKRPGSNSFEESVLADTVIQLGEELMLRSVVNEGDGWKNSLVGPILISGLISKKSALLVDQQGCLNPAMKNICPKQPHKTSPLSTEMHFRAFLFQESPQGDEMVVSVRTQGCLHPQDCIQKNLLHKKMDFPSTGAVEIHRKPLTPIRTRRKLSIPVVLPQHLSSLNDPQAAFRRRFSNVGDAVTRKLSTTIGWRAASILNVNPPEEVVAVGRALCTLYIRTRLKKAGLFNKKLGLTRVRSAMGSLVSCSNTVREVFPGLSCACQELERMYPKLYTNISRHTGPPPAEGHVGVLLALGHHILRSEPTWGKVVSIYCIAAGLALDSVRQGQSEQLHVILEDMSELLEDRMANWVHCNGGWNGLSKHCRQKIQEVSITEYFTVFGTVAVILVVAYFIVRFTVRFA